MVTRPVGRGRRKIDMVAIQREECRLVTFSKRRNGLFSKAAKICSQCSAEVAIVMFSPNDRPYAFGHPSTDSVIDRFLGRDPTPGKNICRRGFGGQIDGNNQQRTVGDPISAKESDGVFLDMSIEKMDMGELVRQKEFLEKLKNKVANRFEELNMRRKATREFFR